MQVIEIMKIVRDYGNEIKRITINDAIVEIAKQKTGYGIKSFFECPSCFERRTKLYVNNSISCRSCRPVSPYRALQNSTGGGYRELTYRMIRLGKIYNIPVSFPFSFRDPLLSRPKYYRLKKWDKGLHQLQILENMRFCSVCSSGSYSPKLISKVLENWDKIPYTIFEIERYMLDWENMKL